MAWNHDGIPDRPMQPPLHLHEMDEDPRTIEKEQHRAALEDKYGRTGRLEDRVRECIANAAERVRDNATFQRNDEGETIYLVSEDDMDDLDSLLDDLNDIQKEGW